MRVAKPFWTDGGSESREAQLQLAGIVALSLGTTAVSVGFNYLGRDFYNALSERQEPEFYRLLGLYIGAIAAAIPGARAPAEPRYTVCVLCVPACA